MAFCRLAWGPLALAQVLAHMNIHTLAQWFRWALLVLGLDPRRFTPAGLRAGGATHDYLMGNTVERLMWRGRWLALSTLRHYVQECASVLAVAQMEPTAQTRLRELELVVRDFVHILTVTWQ